MAKYFGTNGIRGVFDEDFTLEFIHEMTLSVGTYFEKGPILIGYDGRESSPLICKIITSSLNSIGIDCNVAGLVPTPCLEYAVKSLGYSGGIMITASHNPPQYNGIKPAGKDGVEISREDELLIENIVDHIDHICQLTGSSNHVGLGSDLDGGFGKEQCPSDLGTIADLQKLDGILKKRGYSDEDINKIFNKNFIDFLKRVL